MTNNKEQALAVTEQLINVALAGIHNNYGLIHNYLELAVAKNLLGSMIKIKKSFTIMKCRAWKKYKKSFNGVNLPDITQLTTYYTACKCEFFYQQEIKNIKNTIKEYWVYLISNGILLASVSKRIDNFNYLTGKVVDT